MTREVVEKIEFLIFLKQFDFYLAIIFQFKLKFSVLITL